MTREPSGPGLEEPGERLLRQVPPAWLQDGRVTSQAFKPMPKDQGLLSVSRGSRISPEAAYDRHVNVLGFKSAGVWCITVQDCSDEELRVYADPIDEPPHPDPAHALVDFRHLAEKRIVAHAKHLAQRANVRGPLFRPPDRGQRFL
jgi:hypothetical protein